MADRDPKELHEAQHFETVVAVDAPKVPELDKRKKRMKILAALVAAKVVIGAGW